MPKQVRPPLLGPPLDALTLHKPFGLGQRLVLFLLPLLHRLRWLRRLRRVTPLCTVLRLHPRQHLQPEIDHQQRRHVIGPGALPAVLAPNHRPVRQIVGEIGRPEDFPPTGEDHFLRVKPILAPKVRTQRRTVPLQQGKERQEFGFKASNSSCTNSAIAVMVTRPSFRRTSFTFAICSASSRARSAGMKLSSCSASITSKSSSADRSTVSSRSRTVIALFVSSCLVCFGFRSCGVLTCFTSTLVITRCPSVGFTLRDGDLATPAHASAEEAARVTAETGRLPKIN